MRVLVTGARGFVGGHLLPLLIDRGWEVTATDRELEVTDRNAVEAKLKQLMPQAIVHLAAQSSVAASHDEPELTLRVNYLGALSVLRGAQHCGSRPRVLLIGSADQYGTTDLGSEPFTEASPLRPSSAYARSKAEADQLGAAFAEVGLPIVRIRAFNHSGPGQPDTFVLSSFARQIAEIEVGQREPVLRVGNLESVRDFLDVGDVVEAYIRLLNPQVEPTVYNVCSGVGVQLGVLLEALLERATIRPRIECDPERFRATDFSVGDASRLRAATGWEPVVPIEQTLDRLLDYWRQAVTGS
jgi:GDP-4-dehydro-6-deoxy-D-mannose reductase